MVQCLVWSVALVVLVVLWNLCVTLSDLVCGCFLHVTICFLVVLCLKRCLVVGVFLWFSLEALYSYLNDEECLKRCVVVGLFYVSLEALLPLFKQRRVPQPMCCC